jgi:hypothetical protein
VEEDIREWNPAILFPGFPGIHVVFTGGFFVDSRNPSIFSGFQWKNTRNSKKFDGIWIPGKFQISSPLGKNWQKPANPQ